MDTLSVILLESQLLDRNALASALAHARADSLPLQVYLVRQGLVNEGDLVAALKRSVLVGEAESEELQAPEARALEAVPRELAEAFHLLPLRIDDQGHLVVAMSNPTDTHAIDELSYRTGLYITRLVAPVTALEAALDRWYKTPGGTSVAPPGAPRVESPQQPAEGLANDGVVLLTKVKRRPSSPASAAPVEPTDVVPLTKVKRKAAANRLAARTSVQSGPGAAQQAPVAAPGGPKRPPTQTGIPVHPKAGAARSAGKAAAEKSTERATERPSGRQETLRIVPPGQPAPESPGPQPQGGGGAWSVPEESDAPKVGRKKQSTLVGLPTKSRTQRKGSERRHRAGDWKAPGHAMGLRSVAFDSLRKKLASCNDPNEVGRSLAEYLHHWYDRVLFLVVRGQALEGRHAEGLPEGTDPRQVRVSLSETSTLSHVVAARTPYQGHLSAQGPDATILTALGVEEQVLVVPILIRSRVVALLCAGARKASLPERELGDMVVLAESMYEKILAERKKQRPSS